MTKKEESQQSLNINFKLKIIKKLEPPVLREVKLSQGLYGKLNNANKVTYTPGNFSLKLLEEAIGDLYFKNQKDEYRKEFSITSKIFKQTYKFG